MPIETARVLPAVVSDEALRTMKRADAAAASATTKSSRIRTGARARASADS
jgi:hypothetical protein